VVLQRLATKQDPTNQIKPHYSRNLIYSAAEGSDKDKDGYDEDDSGGFIVDYDDTDKYTQRSVLVDEDDDDDDDDDGVASL
jgi:hypothetical protein